MPYMWNIHYNFLTILNSQQLLIVNNLQMKEQTAIENAFLEDSDKFYWSKIKYLKYLSE